MKIHKVVVVIVDHDELGADKVREVLSNANYPNDCIMPSVVSVDTQEVDWSDDHPLNDRDTWKLAFDELFQHRPGFVLTYSDLQGRRTFGTTDTPVELLADRVMDGLMAVKQLDGVKAYVVAEERSDQVTKAATDLARLLRTAENARLSPRALAQRIQKKTITDDQLEQIRTQLRRRHPEENYDPPWPEAPR